MSLGLSLNALPEKQFLINFLYTLNPTHNAFEKP